MTCGLLLVLLAVLTSGIWIWQFGQHQQDGMIVSAIVQRLLKPRAPQDCSICRQPPAIPLGTISTHQYRRGANKKSTTFKRSTDLLISRSTTFGELWL